MCKNLNVDPIKYQILYLHHMMPNQNFFDMLSIQ